MAQNKSWLKRKDKQLEKAGLLNYQTKGLSADEVARRYQQSGVKVNEKWFNEQYGGRTNVQPVPGPNVMQGGQADRPRFAPLNPQLSPTTAASPQIQGQDLGGAVQPPKFTYSIADNGLLRKAKGVQGTPVDVNLPGAPDPNFIAGASLDDALSGQANWTDVSVRDRTNTLKDPDFYKQNKIMAYPKWMQQQILADPAFDWKQLPKWQKPYFEASSSPATMGAIQGGILGLGNPGGAIAGAIIGLAAGKSGYDQTKEFWQQNAEDKKFTWNWDQLGDAVRPLFGLANWLAEQAEKTVGLGFQVANAATDPNKKVSDITNDIESAWNAGAVTGEVFAPVFKSVMEGDGKFTAEDILKISPPLYVLAKIGELIKNPEKYKGQELYLGANSPIQLDQTWIERIEQARKEIKGGRNYREVMTEMQTGVMAQIGDMAIQGIADPLNVMPRIETRTGAVIAKAGGHDVAAQALRTSTGLTEAARKYKTLVQTSGLAQTIEPAFKVDQMGLFSRMVAGITTEGEVRKGSLVPVNKGLLDPVTKKYGGFVDSMLSQTPHSRAQTGAGMFYENVGALLTMFDDPHDAGKYLKALANNDMETWAQLGTRFAESPEFYTILPALKDFNASELDGFITTWDQSQTNRDALLRFADVLGEEPAKLLDDWGKRNTHEQDMARIVERLKESKSAEAKAMLAEIEAGKLTPDTLKQIVDVFHGEGALPFHPGQWKALMLDKLGSHFDEWVTKRLMLDQSPEAVSAFFRTTALMKQAQSILLLGGSPGYALTNGMSNMTHRMMTGNFGYLTPNQINGFMDRLGVTPARFEEGVGIGGQVEMAAGKSKAQMDAMTKAVKGRGALTTTKDILSKISRAMPMSKLSAWFEKTESKQAFVIGMKQFWSQSWRRGVGFSKMGPDLARVIGEMGIDPNRIYAAIEAGMNQTEIEKQLFGRYEGVQARSLINDAAQKTGLTASRAASMLDEIGALDMLDQHLKGKTTPDGVRSAFTRANQTAQDWIDMQTGEDLKAIAESVKQRVDLEVPAAALDVVQKANGIYFDTWMDHYHRFGEVMSDILAMDDPAMIDKALDLNYRISGDEFRRVNARTAANWKGILDAWGLSGNPEAMTVLSSLGEMDAGMGHAYERMREIRKGLSDKHRGEKGQAFFDDLNAANKSIDALFKDAFKAKHKSEVRMGGALAKIYESLYGPAAGEAARLWWEDVTKFNDEIVKREGEFRESVKGMDKDDRAIAKQKYYSETKIAMIAELEKINSEGIGRLERVIKKGPSSGGAPVTPSPQPSPTGRGGGGLTPEAQDILNKIDAGDSMPAFVTNNLRRVAAENGLVVDPSMNAQSIVDKLRLRLVEEQFRGTGQADVPAEVALRAEINQPIEQQAQATSQIDARLEQNKREGVSSSADEINALMAAAEQRKAQEAKVQSERLGSIWDVAEEYARVGLPYDRTILQDKFALLGALRKAEYGGDPAITGLNDERVTPELVKQVLEARNVIKDAEEMGVVAQAVVNAGDAASNVKAPNIHENTTILAAIKEHGGLDKNLALDITGEKRPKSAPGVFTNKGVNIDEMARMLADDGYPIDLNRIDDPGGIIQTTELINRQRKGDKVYPVGHDHEAMIARAQNDAAVKAFSESLQETPFDLPLWQTDFTDTIARGDLTRMYELIGDFPDELVDTLTPQGETFRDFMSRTADEIAARVEQENQNIAVAESMARSEAAIQAQETKAEAVTTRNLLKEKFEDVFGLTEEQSQAYMEMSDSIASWYEKATGESGDQFYARYYRDVVNAGSEDLTPTSSDALYQIEPINRKMTAAEIEGYARALVRAGEGELSSAIRNEASKADRKAILDAAHKLDPAMAEKVAAANLDKLFQEHKGVVTFGKDGIQATIHAFEARDFSTLVHENAHVFRKVLKDVAERTNNPRIIEDLATIEQWAGVKDGKWGRQAEEKFARGFEQYLATGKAPTPKLVRAFRMFRNFMLEIYKTITGSGIDVKMTQEVTDVFGRMLGADGRTVTDLNGTPMHVGERVVFGDKQMDIVNILDDGRAVLENDAGDTVTTRPGQFEQVVRLNLEVDQAARAREAQSLKEGLLADPDFQEKLRKIKESRQTLPPSATPQVVEKLKQIQESQPVLHEDMIPSKGLADFGEKLGGARKDRVQFTERKILDGDIAKMALSELWPKSELATIENNDLAALATALRAEIPSKPRDSWKLKRWVEQVKTIRELMQKATEMGVDQTLEYARARTALKGFVDKVSLMREVPREHWGRIEDVHNYPDAHRYVEGKQVPSPYASARVDGRTIKSESYDGLVAKVQEALKVNTKAVQAMKFEIRGNRKEVFINKTGDPLYRKLKTFSTPEEARAFISGNYDDLVKAWEGVKESDNVKETDVRRGENRPRSGKDQRRGKDATPEMFLDSFGFRGVEFGNWVSQGANIKERQGMLNGAYDALMDLSDIVGVPPKALSLDGTLGLGLGSRGSGSASAHYEPSAIVINLTKTRGAGTFAHEWFHALDNYFQRNRGQMAVGLGEDSKHSGSYITYQPESRYRHGPTGQTLPVQRFEELKSRKGIRNPDEWSLVEGVRPEVEQKFTDLVKALDESPMNKRAKLVDKGKSGGYWSRVIERAARSFENYVIYKMGQEGYQNDYLANVANVEEFARDPGRYPYLLDSELAPVAEAFDNLFNTIETRETPRGLALFQDADQPFGAYDEASGFVPQSGIMDSGWREKIRPLMDAMQEGALDQLNNKPLDGATRDMSPEGQTMLRQYTNKVKGEMASTKLATVRWGEQQRDFAMLNYSKRYGIDRPGEAGYPYELYYTREGVNLLARAIDKPALLSNYARLKMQQQRYERDIPERLRGRIKLSAPWLPEWMGDSVYIDPLSQLFPPAAFLRPFERMQQDKNYQQIEAERILQEWAQDGTYTDAELQQAAQSRSGTVYERAFAEAQQRRESEIANPIDFMNTMLGPAWYLTTPYKLLTGKDRESVNTTPLLNTARGIDTVTQGTWAEPIGDVIGLLGKPEEWARKKLNLPEFGEYGDYYTDRQLSNMVAEGKITSEQAVILMIERTGPLFDEARERVKMEMAVRVPTMGTLYAGLHGGPVDAAKAFLPSLFGAGLLPAGELEYRGLKQEWNEAWDQKDKGNDGAINRFFEDHPEYEAYLGKGKPPEERLKSFLIGQIWDGYMSLGPTNKKEAASQMGELFSQAFLDKETRSYDTLDVDTLTQWAQMLGKMVPAPQPGPPVARYAATSPQIQSANLGGGKLNLYDTNVTDITDQFFTQRTQKFPDFYEEQNGYYALATKSEQVKYLLQHPQLKKYWDWKDSWYNAYPQYKPIMNGQVFKQVDTSNWPPALLDYVQMYAMTGKRLPSGAYKALEQVWISEGQPMDDMKSWLNSVVVPSMLYGQ